MCTICICMLVLNNKNFKLDKTWVQKKICKNIKICFDNQIL